MKTRNWYFQGWERGDDGAFRYTGEYYTLPTGKPKAITIGLGAALAVLYGLTAFFPSEGGMWRIAAIPQLLELIPIIYLVIGAVCLARVRTPMVYRGWYASWRRMKTAAVWSLAVTAAMALVELVYLFVSPEPKLGQELFFLLRVLGCAALSFGLYRYMSTHPCTQSAVQ